MSFPVHTCNNPQSCVHITYEWPDPKFFVAGSPPHIEDMGYFGNVWVRRHLYLQAGDTNRGHEHEFDHISFAIRGEFDVQVGDRVTRYVAPTFIIMKAKEHHKITARTDKAEWWCVFALRNKDGSVIEVYDPAIHSPYGIH